MAYTTINKSSDHFKALYYSGTGSENAITSVGHQPDFVWLKQANGTDHHTLYDSVRGATKYVLSNLSNAEATNAQSLKSFDSDGFTLGTDSAVNSSSHNFIGHSWKAGTTSGLSGGTITPTSYSINATAGFGIYKWSRTGSSTTDYFVHGLGVTPKIAFQKRLDGVQDWYVNHTLADGSFDYMQLNNTQANSDDSTTAPTSSYWYPKSPETGDYITYLFAEKQGYSKFGLYKGNGSTDGAFVYTGFKPAFIMLKYSSGGGTGAWQMYNMTLNKTNKSQFFHHDANTNTQWYDNQDELDVFANGFKARGSTVADSNTSNGRYIFMAWAEAPLVGSNNVPCTAR